MYLTNSKEQYADNQCIAHCIMLPPPPKLPYWQRLQYTLLHNFEKFKTHTHPYV